MLKRWKILNEKEIKALNEKDLENYLSWLKKQKISLQNNLSSKKIILNKLVNFQEKQRFAKIKIKDDENLSQVRQELNT